MFKKKDVFFYLGTIGFIAALVLNLVFDGTKLSWCMLGFCAGLYLALVTVKLKERINHDV